MPGKYLLKRIILLFPGLFMVVFLAFLLKNLVPGDPVETIMLNRGMSWQDAALRTSEYSKIYISEGLNKPLFYFSVLPDHHPENIRSITNPEQKKEISFLLKNGYPYSNILEFLNLKYNMEKNGSAPNASDPADSLVHVILQKEPLPEKALSAILAEKWTGNTRPTSCIQILENMISNRKSWFLPSFHFYGTNNQFHDYFKGLLNLDFGLSSKDGKKVTDKIFSALKWTATLVFFSMTILAIVSIPLGLWSGRYENGKLDIWTGNLSIILYAIPVFWLASMLIIFCTTDQYGWWLHIFPSVGTWYDVPGSSFLQNLAKHASQLILPVICMVANDFAFLIRLIKKQTIEQKHQLYVKMAIAKGLDEKSILTRHILPNVGIQILSVFTGSIPAAFAGSLIVEVIFNIPGMGRLLYHSINSSDWNVVFGILIVLAFLTILINIIGDFMYVRLNPKISYHD